MKKFVPSIIALCGALAANAESLVVEHFTEMALGEEITAALEAAKLTASQITELKIVCPIPENSQRGADLYWATSYKDGECEDCGRIRTMLPQLQKLDVSEAFFRYNETGEPTGAGYFMKGMKHLVEVWLPEGLNALGGESFRACTSLKTVHFPESIHSLGSRAFAGCTSLVMDELPETITILSGEVFYCNENSDGGKTNLPNIKFTKLPVGITQIGDRAFQGTKCTFSELPSGLTTIGYSAFREAPVTFSYLPESVETLGYITQGVKQYDTFIMCEGITNFDLTGIYETEVPNRTFYISNAVKRTFTCRAAKAPDIMHNSQKGGYEGSFGQTAVLGKTTIRILKDAEATYTGDWALMEKEFFTTPVEVAVESPEGGNVTINHQYHGDLTPGTHDIYEGSNHKWTFTPDAGYYITSVSYDDDELYAPTEGDTKGKAVEVLITVTQTPGKVTVSIAKSPAAPDAEAGSLSEYLELAPNDGDEAKMNCELLVTYANGNYVYVTDNPSPTFAAKRGYALINKEGLSISYKALDIIPAGWKARTRIINGLPQIVPVDESEMGTAGSADNFNYDKLDSITTDYVNDIVEIDNVTFDSETDGEFSGVYNEETYNFYNQFGAKVVEAGEYNMTVAVSINNGTLQLLPIEYRLHDKYHATLSYKQHEGVGIEKYEFLNGDFSKFTDVTSTDDQFNVDGNGFVFFRFELPNENHKVYYRFILGEDTSANARARVASRAGEDNAKTPEINVGDDFVEYKGGVVHPQSSTDPEDKNFVPIKGLEYYTENGSGISTSTRAVTLSGGITGIEDLFMNADGAEAQYYNLQGVRVMQPATGEIYIRVVGKKATKVVFY